MKPDSFRGKIFLSFIDKALIGVVVFIITMTINLRFEDFQRIHEESIAVAKIHSEILERQRDRLIESMDSFFEQAPKIHLHSGGIDEKLRDLRVLSEKVSIIFIGMSKTDSSLEKDFENLSNQMVHFTVEIRRLVNDENIGEDEYLRQRKKILAEVKDIYGGILDSLNRLCIRTLRDELEKI